MNRNTCSSLLLTSGFIFSLLVVAVTAGEEPTFADRTSESTDSEETIGDDDILLVSSARRYSVSSQTFVWRDEARRRSIPVKIFYPSTQHDEAFPVIVFSHGLGGSYNRCSYLGSAWASKGFVAVMVQHPGSDENIWKGKVRILQELQESYKYNWSGRTRAEDLRFVLDQLEYRLAQRIDLTRIGVGGYDLGALASLLLAGQKPPDGGPSLADSRIKAIVAMSPPVNRPQKSYQAVYAGVTVPVLFVSGTDDDGIVGSTKASQRRIPFDAMSQGNRYLVILQGADHQIYGGHMISLSLKARNDKKFQAAIVRASGCFWQAHLQEDARALTILNGYGLNAILGGLARVERRLPDSETASEDVLPKEYTESSQQTLPMETDTEEKTVVPVFPLTRYYRSISDRYGQTLLTVAAD